MYSTCLFCHANLGKNDVIEPFPVGRRLAFDAAKGRLWVVCRKCGRWNLSPLEERWEAIEECERRFRDTSARVQTDNVGLAKLADGLEVVRIGRPLRPEFAAWRYATEFRRRRRRSAVAVGALGAIGGAALGFTVVPSLPMILMVAGFTSITMPWATFPAGAAVLRVRDYIVWDRVIARVPDGEGGALTVRAKHLRNAEFRAGESGGGLAVVIPHDLGEARFTGPRALAAAGQLLSRTNQLGASDREVNQAVASIERAGDAAGYLSAADIVTHSKGGKRFLSEFRPLGAFQLLPVERLAFEMAAHEEAERRAMEGELKELERAWKEAEEIAAIADLL